MLLNIFLTLFFVFLNGFFVAAEFAIVKIRMSQVELLIRGGSKIAKTTKHIISHLDSYLSATQFGITFASLGLGWIGESVVAGIIIDLMNFFGIAITDSLARSIALPTAFATITVLHIVFGELAPKSLAIANPERVSMFISLPIRIFFILFKPIIWLLNSFANLVIKLFGIEPYGVGKDIHTEEELRFLLEESSKGGEIGRTEHKMLENVFDFSDIPIKQIMVSRNKIVAIENSTPTEDIINRVIEEGYTRLPVYKGTIDNITGLIYTKDLITLMSHKDLIVFQDLIRLPFFISENEHINTLFQIFQKQKIHLAVAQDEFGGTAGIVTLEDIIEEVFGEIQDEYDEELPIVEKKSDFEFIVRASANISDVNDHLPLPLPESDEYETVAGLVTHTVGYIPEVNAEINLENYSCKILKRTKRKIDLVRLVVTENRDMD